MVRLIVLALLLLPVTVSAQTVLNFTGAETGDLSEVTSTTAGAAATSTNPHTGNYAYRFTAQNAHLQSNSGVSGTTIYVREYFRWDVNNNIFSIIVPANGAGTQFMEVMISNATSKLCWAFNSTTCAVTGTAVLTTGTYYLLEAKFVIDASVGGAEIKVNGVVDISTFVTNTSAIVAWGLVEFGPDNGRVGTVDHTHDDIMICSGAYCPSGGTIARQGAAGTPTYNTWTKNSCTGGTIDGCWSNTPFSTGSSASSSTVNNAQTMFVAPFSATQAGHGTETIGPSSTINACKTFMVAKGASGTPSIKIRRVLAGIATDTTKALTTSDAGYDNGIWTTPPGELRGSTMEIGVVQNQTTVIETVEDMWQMCDFLNNSAPLVHRTKQD